MKRNYLFAIMLLLGACSKDDESPGGGGSSVIPKVDYSVEAPQSAFPVTVGSWWRYSVFPRFPNDTLLLEVMSVSTQNGVSDYSVKVSAHNAVVDTGHFLVSPGVIAYSAGKDNCFGYCGGLFEKVQLSFPLRSGYRFKNDQYGSEVDDSTTVKEYSLHLPLLGNTYDGYNMQRTGNDHSGTYFTQDLFVAPGIGVVRQNIVSKQDSGPQQGWFYQLIDYHIN